MSIACSRPSRKPGHNLDFDTDTDLALITALRAALLELGYFDVYHIASLMVENPSDSEMWCQAIDAKFYGKGKPYDKEQWDKLLGHCMVS